MTQDNGMDRNDDQDQTIHDLVAELHAQWRRVQGLQAERDALAADNRDLQERQSELLVERDLAREAVDALRPIASYGVRAARARNHPMAPAWTNILTDIDLEA